MKSRFHFTLLAGASLLTGCVTRPARHIDSQPVVISDFTFPWSTKQAPRTEFTAAITGGRLNFTFDVDDSDIVITKRWLGESTLDGEDRVEIFFAHDAALEEYFCIEIDPLGRVHDYATRHYRKFDSSWNCPGLSTLGRRTVSGYRVEGSIPLASLEAMLRVPVRSGSVLRLGLFRAEFYGVDSRTRGEAGDNWLSWVRPDVKTPDFHVPSAFKAFRLP